MHADEPELFGVFTHLKTVRGGRSWLYAGDDSLIGDLTDLDEIRSARFVAPFWTPESPIQAGDAAPWLDAWWQAFQLTMILDSSASRRRTEFIASPAQHFLQGDVSGWTKAGNRLPDDAFPTNLEAEGWDHEHCELCESRIGLGGEAYGFVDDHDRWLCESCYERYAAPRSLAFVFGVCRGA